jgi:hypothetical protein
VVTEAPTGKLVTHWFLVRRRPDLPGGAINNTDDVMVPDGENIVYIPERCIKMAEGDFTCAQHAASRRSSSKSPRGRK